MGQINQAHERATRGTGRHELRPTAGSAAAIRAAAGPGRDGRPPRARVSSASPALRRARLAAESAARRQSRVATRASSRTTPHRSPTESETMNPIAAISSPVERARANMIAQQIRTWDVLSQDVLDLLQVVRREEFVPE